MPVLNSLLTMPYYWGMELRLIIAVLAVSLLTGCGERFVRDEYMGKAFFQPDKVPRLVEYDGLGNAIIDQAEIIPAPSWTDQKT